jgi:group I intron endonuclease
MKNLGIYKITSPSGKVYIGQSTEIDNRWKYYSKVKCKDQPKLYNSLKKYSWEKHMSEVIEECLVEQLDEKEIFYKQQFINEFGWNKALFCHLIDGKGGYKACGRKEGENRSKYPACRPTPAGCKRKGKGKTWGKTK